MSLNDDILAVQHFGRNLDIQIERVSAAGNHKSFSNFIKRMRFFDNINTTWVYIASSTDGELAEAEKSFDAGQPVNLFCLNLRFTLICPPKDRWSSSRENQVGLRVEAFDLELLFKRARESMDAITTNTHPYFVETYGSEFKIVPRR